MELRVDPTALIAAGQALTRVGSDLHVDVDAVTGLVRLSAEQLGTEHAGPALLATWCELSSAVESLADGYGELGRAFSSLAPAYSSFDARVMPR